MFGKRIDLFSVFGFPIRIDISWLFIVALVTWTLASGLFPIWYEDLGRTAYWIMGFVGALGLFASIVVHELSHALVARRHGMPMKGITLFIFGGLAEMQDEPPSARAEFRVAIAGPIASIAVALACWLIAQLGTVALWSDPVRGVFEYLAYINAILVVFNMIPAFPLDGGRVLRSIIWKSRGDLRRATRISSEIGSGFGTALIVLGVIALFGGAFVGGFWWILIGLFLRHAAQMSYQQVLVRRALEGEPVHRFMRPDPRTVPPSATIQQVVDDYILESHHKMYPVTEKGYVFGCVTIKQIKEVPRDKWADTRVRDIAHPGTDGSAIHPDDDAVKALSVINSSGQSRLMVVDNRGKLVGILSLKDLMKFISLKVELEENQVPPHLLHPDKEA